jgi:hypothetical protein
MIVVRNVFRLKFGKAREAQQLMKENLDVMGRFGFRRDRSRVLTDVVGNFYTLVLENTFESLREWEDTAPRLMNEPAWREGYQKMLPLVESGYREVLQVVE